MSEVTVNIFDRDYRLAVSNGEEELIGECAKAVDAQMQALRSTGRIFGNDQIAVLTALQLAYEARKAQEAEEEKKEGEARMAAAAPVMTQAETAAALEEVRSLCRLCEDALFRNTQIGTKMGTLF